MKFLYLYAELMPYQIVVFKELVNNYNVKIIAVHWDKKKLTPFQLSDIDGINFVPRSGFKTKEELLQFAKAENPTVIVCSGWMDNFYNYVAKIMKKKGTVVVAASDTQWKGGKQWINILLSNFRQKKWFSYIWVAGCCQFEYARKLGFKNNAIIFNSLTADVNLYKKSGEVNLANESIPHSFVFIGRFAKVKGISIMMEAFNQLKKEYPNDWKLVCIGTGDQKILLEDKEDVEVIDFMSQEEICSMSDRFGIFLLPSIAEPWGLVIHEAVCLGLPLLTSNICGSNSSFLIEGYNGYSFEPNSINDLKDKMKKIISLSNDELLQMKSNSYDLSFRITPRISAASLMSVVNKN